MLRGLRFRARAVLGVELRRVERASGLAVWGLRL